MAETPPVIQIEFTDKTWQRLQSLLHDKEQLNRIEAMLRVLLRMEKHTMAKIDDLLNDVTAETTVIDGVLTLLQSLKDQLAAQGVDQGKIDAAFAAVEANKTKLAAALDANVTPPPTV